MTVTIRRYRAIATAACVAALLLGVDARAQNSPKRAATLPILVYHEIRSEENGAPDGPTVISLDQFEREMRTLKAMGVTTLSMDEVVRFLKGEPFPEPSVAIHMDDGWKSGFAALPIFEALKFKATFWIISGTGIGWPHMDWTEIDALAKNPSIDIYAHTLTHPWKNNDTLPDWLAGRTPGRGLTDVQAELGESKRILEQRLGRAIPYLAWPSGFYNDDLITLAQQAGYTALLTIDDGVNVPGDSPLRIKRTMVHGACSDEVFRQILMDGRYRECAPPSTIPR